MKLIKDIDNKTILFISENKGIALGYYRTSFRNGKNACNLSILRQVWKRARKLESELPVMAKYAELLGEVKRNTYKIRTDLERPVETSVHPIIEENQMVTVSQAWALQVQGLGTSVFTGKKSKALTCKEKILKLRRGFIDALNSLI